MNGEKASNPNFAGFVYQGNAYEGLTCNALEWSASSGGGTFVDSSNKVTINKGRHNLRVVFEYQDIRYQQQGEVNPRGNFSFSGVFTDPQGTTRAGTALALLWPATCSEA